MHHREWPLEKLVHRILHLEIRARSRMAEWLELVAEFDRRGAAQKAGFRGTAEWLAWECRLEARTAREHVRIARRLSDLPQISRAFADGRLSYSHARALARASEEEDEAELLRVALISSTVELERHIRQLRSSAAADLDVANAGRARRSVKWFWDEDGSLRFFGRLGAEEGALFVEAVETAVQTLAADGDDPCCAEGWARPPLGAQRADALVEALVGGGVHTELVLHADLAALECHARGDEARAGDTCALRDGPAIPSEMARRLTCDARVSLRGLNLGRTTRTVTPTQRRALEVRHGRVCCVPGCHRTHGLEAHHIRHWAEGGGTDLDNLALVCRYHHRSVHEDGFRLTRRRGTLVLQDARGRDLRCLPAARPRSQSPPSRASPARSLSARSD